MSSHDVLFFFNDPATTEIYTLSLHDALPIPSPMHERTLCHHSASTKVSQVSTAPLSLPGPPRSEEHTSELQSQFHLVCRLLLEKKKTSYPPLSTMFNHDVQTLWPIPLHLRYM